MRKDGIRTTAYWARQALTGDKAFIFVAVVVVFFSAMHTNT